MDVLWIHDMVKKHGNVAAIDMRYARWMPQPQSAPGSGRETRLLLMTIALAVGALLLLARFRFPEHAAQSAEAPPAPLERLARGAFDDLASTMADLERRIVARTTVLRVIPPRSGTGYIVAPRVTPDRAVAIVNVGESLQLANSAAAEVVATDLARGIAIVAVPYAEDVVAMPRTGVARPGPRYVVVVDATANGPALRPLYAGRTAVLDQSTRSTPLLSLEAVQYQPGRGAAIFSLDGLFLGLVSESAAGVTLITGEFLKGAAENAQPSAQRAAGDLGLEVQEPTGALLRAAGAKPGVVVSHVRPTGPSAGSVNPGDVIRAIDGLATPDVTVFRQVERTRPPGSTVTITLIRRGKETAVSSRVSTPAETAQSLDDIGVVGQAVAGAGIDVIAVVAGSAADRSGLQRNDLIVTIDGKPATDPGTLSAAFRNLTRGEAMILTLQRDQQHLAVALEKSR